MKTKIKLNVKKSRLQKTGFFLFWLIFNFTLGCSNDTFQTSVDHLLNGSGSINNVNGTANFTLTASSATEGVGVFSIEVNLDKPLSSDATLQVTDSLTGSAAAGIDYNTLSTSAPVDSINIIIPAGSTVANVNLTIVDDSIFESAETINISLQAISNNVTAGTNSAHIITINDNDAVPIVNFALASSSTTDEGTALTVNVSLTGAASTAVTVDVVDAASGTATSGTDFTAIPLTTLTFPAGTTGPQSVTVTPVQDSVYEGNETVVLNIQNPSANALIGVTSNHTFTITDDENTPSINFALASSSTINEGTALTVNVSLTGTASTAVTVEVVDAASGTATSGTDFTAIPLTTLTFPAGTTGPQSVTVTPVQDSVYEGNETVTLNIQNPSANATIGTVSNHIVTITDDEVKPSINYALASSNTTNEGTALTVNVSLTGAASTAVTVDVVDAASGTATSGTDFIAIPLTTLTFPAGTTGPQSVIVTPVQDSVYEGNETVVLNIQNPSVNALIGVTSSHTFTITDDENTPSINFDLASASTVDEGTALTVNVSLTGAASTAVTVDVVDAASGTATSGTDFTAIPFTTLTFPAGTTGPQSIIVTPLQDTLDEDTGETIILGIQNNSANSLIGATSIFTGTITDDDGANITNVTTAFGVPPQTHYFTNGGIIDVNVVFSQSVNVVTTGGVPVLTLGTGGIGGDAIYSSGSGSNTLIFRYIVGATDSALDLDYLSTNALNLNGGTITGVVDLAAANLLLPLLGSPQSLSGNMNIVIDNGAPLVSGIVISSPVSGTYTTGQTILFDVTFTEIINVTGVPVLDINSSSAVNEASYISGSGTDKLTFSYTIQSGDTTNGTNLDAINVSALVGTIQDLAGVPFNNLAGLTGVLPTAGSSVIVDTALPTMVGISVSAISPVMVDNIVTFQVTFNENVIVNNAGSNSNIFMTLNSQGTALTPPQAIYSGGSGTNILTFTYTVASGNAMIPDLTGTLDYFATNAFSLINGATITDNALNNLNSSLPSPGTAGFVTGTSGMIIQGAPYVSQVYGVNGTYIAGNNVDITVQFSEIVNITGLPTLTLDNGQGGGVAAYFGGSGSNLIVFRYTVVAGDTSGDLAYLSSASLSGGGGTIQSAGGVTALLTLPQPGISINSLSSTSNIILDTGNRNVDFLAASSSAAEGVGTKAVTVRLSQQHGIDTTIEYTVTTGSAKTGLADPDNDFTLTSGSLIIPAGSVTGTISVPVIDDNWSEPTESFTITINAIQTISTYLSVSGNVLHTLSVTDNDISYIQFASSSSSTIDESAIINSVNVTLSKPVSTNVAVDVFNDTADAGNSATITADYSYTLTPLTFTPGQVAKVISYTPVQDTIDEGTGENIVFKFQSISANVTQGVTFVHTATITDDDNPPTIDFSLASSSAAENGAPVTINLALSNTSASAVTVSVVDPGTGTALANGVDYVNLSASAPLNAKTVTFAPGSFTASLTFTPVDDLIYEGNETVNLTLSNASANAVLGSAVQTHTLTITDNETFPVITFSAATSTTALGTTETAVAKLITVNLSHAASTIVSVDVAQTGGTASNGADYANYSTTRLNFNAGVTSQTISITPIDDNIDEADETVILTLQAPSANATIGATSVHTLTIGDNDGTPVISFTAAASTTVDESATLKSILVNLTNPSSSAITVNVAQTGGTAINGTDYSAYTTQTLTFNAGVTSQSFSITPIQDNIDEGSGESVIFTLQTPNAAGTLTGSTNLTHTLTITDDDNPPTIYFFSAASATSDESATLFEVSVLLSHPSSAVITVDLVNDTLNGLNTATSGVDYNVINTTTLTFNAGTTVPAIPFKLTPIDDILNEGAENIILKIQNPNTGTSGATLGVTTTHTATIADDDGTPSVTIADLTVSEGNSGTSVATMTLTLTGISGSNIDVNWASANGTTGTAATIADSDYVTASGMATWTAGQTGNQTISITINGDNKYESLETIDINLTLGAGTFIFARTKGILSILNDDLALTVVSAETLDCNSNGLIDHYKVSLNQAVTDNTFTGFAADALGTLTTTWTVTGYGNVRLDHGTALSCGAEVDTANDAIVYLQFGEGGSPDTGAIPQLIASGATLISTLTSSKVTNNTGIIVNADVVETDKALPVNTLNTSNSADNTYGIGSILDIRMQYSENVTIAGSVQITMDTGAVVNYSSGTPSEAIFNYTVLSGHSSADLDINSIALNGGSITDAAGNNANLASLKSGAATVGALANNKALVIDGVVPAITNVTSSTVNGYYNAGANIFIEVVFDSIVNVTGVPTITLETGVSDAVVSYTSGSGSTTLVFDYIVASGQNSNDLEYFSTSALSLAGGTITDSAGNNAHITLPQLAAAGGTNSLAANKSIVVDTNQPTVTSVSATNANGTYGLGQVITVQVVFSENMQVTTGTGTPSLLLETGAVDANVNYSSVLGNTLTFSYTIASGHSNALLDYFATNALALNNGAIQDLAGNNGILTLPSPGTAGSLSVNKNITVDGIVPNVLSVSSTLPNGAYGAGSVIPITVTFSNSVNVNIAGGTPALAVENGQGTKGVASYNAGSGSTILTFNYTVGALDNNIDLDYVATNSLSLNGGTISKSSGAANSALLTLPAPGSAGSLAANKAIVVDTVAPTVSSLSVTTTAGTYGSGQAINISVLFSESVHVTGTPTLDLNSSGATNEATYSSGTGTNTLVFSYIIASGDTANPLALGLDIAPVNSALQGVIKDTALNGYVASGGLAGKSLTGNAIVIDTTQPGVVSVTAAADGYYKEGQIVTIKVKFSSTITVPGAPLMALSTGVNALYSSLATTTNPNDTALFTYTVGAGENSADLAYVASTSLGPLASIKNGAGTADALLTLPSPGTFGSLSSNSNVVIDTTLPIVNSLSITSPAAGTYGAGQAISIAVLFSEPVTVTATPVINLNSSGVVNEAVYSSGAGTSTLVFTYTVQAGDTTSGLNLNWADVSSLTGTISDLAANNYVTASGLTGKTIGGNAIVIDTAPVLVNFALSNSNGLESVASAVLTVNLSRTSATPVTVNYTTGGTADKTANANTGNIDFTTGTSIVIPAGVMSGTINLAINNDALDENNETVIITLSSAVNASLGTTLIHTYTITDDDDAPAVTFATANSSMPNELNDTVNATPAVATNLPLILTLGSQSELTAQVNVVVTGGTATNGAGGDYTFTTPTAVSFTPGQTSKTVNITPIDDVTAESTETIILSLQNNTNALLGGITSHTVSIIDDDGAPTISVQNVSVAENIAGGLATITVSMAGKTAVGSVTVNYTTINGTAANPADYTSTAGTLTWLVNTTGAKTFTVPVINDLIAESDETVLISLSNPVNATITTGTATLTILNDDASLVISSAQTADCDPVDGKIDHYKLTLSTAVSDSSFDGYPAGGNAEGTVTASWMIAAHNNPRIDHGTALNSICGTDTANDNVIWVKFDQAVASDSGVTSQITAVASSLTATNGTGKLYFNSGNVLATDVAETDGAAPYIWFATATNVGGLDGSAGTGDTLTLKFSETTNAASLAGVDLDSVFCAIVAAGSPVAGCTGAEDFFGVSSDITSAAWSTSTYTNDTLTITFANDNPVIKDADYVKLQGALIKDSVNNGAAATTNVLSPPSIGGTFDSGVRGPTVVSAEYFDTNSNGKIDRVKVTFDVNVNDLTFPGYVGPDQINNVTTTWLISGHANIALDTRTTIITASDNPANDNVLWLTFGENVAYDTGSKPDLTATLGAAGLRDLANGCYLNTTNVSCLNAANAVLSTTHVVESDRANPVMVISTARLSAKYIYLRFSENVWSNTNMPACGSGGQMSLSDFSYTNVVGAFDGTNATNIAGVDISDTCAANDATVVLLANFAFASTDLSNDKINAVSSQVFDAANNAMLNTQSVIYPVTQPYIISAGSYVSAGKYYIRLVFSEDMAPLTALNAGNYTITLDGGTCAANPVPNSIPFTVNALSGTVFDLETSLQCKTGTYKVTGTVNLLDLSEVAPLGMPNSATTVGTDLADTTPPRLMQALSLSSNTVQLTYSEPMKAGDIFGSSECRSTYLTAATCAADVDAGVAGTNLKYTVTPSLGTINSVIATADPSVYIVSHQSVQSGSFYTVIGYANSNVNDIPQDLFGNKLSVNPYDRTTFQGVGTVIVTVGDGPLFNDPFADVTTFSFAFNYRGLIYLGPNTNNNSSFRFEPDGANPTTVTFLTTGGASCASTPTFGYGAAATCDTVTPANSNMGPDGETGIAGFTSGVTTFAGIDYDILMVGPIKASGSIAKVYFTQDIDTQLNWTTCGNITGITGANSKSVMTTYAWGANLYLAVAQDSGTSEPTLNRVPLTVNPLTGVISCGAPVDGVFKNQTGIGTKSTNPAVASGGTKPVLGIDSMYYETAVTPVNTFYLANNGGVAAATNLVSPTAANTDFVTFMTQANFVTRGGAAVTLVLPTAANGGLEKVRPGSRGVPAITKWNNVLYMARNIALDQTFAGQSTNNGGEVWKCSANCTTNTNWSKVLDIKTAGVNGGLPTPAIGSVANNLAISMLQVNGSYLYIGVDNGVDGVRIYRTNPGITALNATTHTDISEQSAPGLNFGYKQVMSASSLSKQGKGYIYITVSNANATAIKVVRQID